MGARKEVAAWEGVSTVLIYFVVHRLQERGGAITEAALTDFCSFSPGGVGHRELSKHPPLDGFSLQEPYQRKAVETRYPPTMREVLGVPSAHPV